VPKLNQIVAIEKGVRSSSYAAVTEQHKRVQKSSLLSGISRTYHPKDEEGDTYPPESTLVQVRAQESIQKASKSWTDLFDITLTKDSGNTEAKADVIVDGETVAADVPISTLLFLEKQLQDVKTFITKLPTLDPAHSWSFDEAQDCYATDPAETAKTKKIPRAFEKSPATKEHPAQVEIFHEDILVGRWRTVKYSGALPASQVNEYLERVEKLVQAIKFAREKANSIEIQRRRMGEDVFRYLFA
jgi:hypothetical protein